MKARIYIFEGTWWNSSEVPLILPYSRRSRQPRGCADHRRIRSIDDVQHYVKNLRVGEQAFLYFAATVKTASCCRPDAARASLGSSCCKRCRRPSATRLGSALRLLRDRRSARAQEVTRGAVASIGLALGLGLHA